MKHSLLHLHSLDLGKHVSVPLPHWPPGGLDGRNEEENQRTSKTYWVGEHWHLVVVNPDKWRRRDQGWQTLLCQGSFRAARLEIVPPVQKRDLR